MPIKTNLEGIIVPLVTPFDDKNRIDLPALRQVVEFVIEKGAHAVMAGGTTGEGMLLSLEERKLLLEAVVAKVNGRVPVVAHTGCIDTGSTVELSRHAWKTGANIISAIVPYFFTLNDEQLYRHFLTVAESVPDAPLLLYTFPGNAKNDITPDLLGRLLKAAPNIAGIKSSNADLMRFRDYVQVGGETFTACFGVDELMLGGLVFGSKAQISGNANSFPEPFVQLYQAYRAGDLALAQELQGFVSSIVNMQHAGSSPAFFKAALALRGVSAGRVRPPMRELLPEEREELKREAVRLGLL